MTHTQAFEERTAGEQIRAGAAMLASAIHPGADAGVTPVVSLTDSPTPRADSGRGVAVFAADALSARPGHSGRANC